MTTLSAYDVATVLVTKATDLQTVLSLTATKNSVDERSDQSYYGVPEAIIDDLRQAIDLVTLVTNKVHTITDPDNLV